MDEQPSAPDTTEPMTPRLMARLFIVPLIIVAMIVGSSVLVVLLFGWISTSQQESTEKLVSRIEAGAGSKVFGVALLPKDKEVWQAALELARRLEPGHPHAVAPSERPEIARRLDAVLDATRGAPQETEGQEMQQFLLSALGNLGQPGSVRVLIDYASDEKQPLKVRQSAISALVTLRTQQAARDALHDALPSLIALLDSPEPVIRISAVIALGALSGPGDADAIAALTRAYRSNDREVAWNAALALARLGSGASLPLLKDMLTRRYWEAQKVDLPGGVSTGGEAPHLTPTQIENYLLVTMDAAAALGDRSLIPYVQRLTDDPSLQVRDRARKLRDHWPATASSPA